MTSQELRATSVDPRYVTEENHTPTYRVDFWDRNRDSDEFRLENARGIDEVLGWAELHRNGRYVVIWVEYDLPGEGTGLVRLHGWEPTNVSSPSFTDPYFDTLPTWEH